LINKVTFNASKSRRDYMFIDIIADKVPILKGLYVKPLHTILSGLGKTNQNDAINI
jgi:hypothetical protein